MLKQFSLPALCSQKITISWFTACLTELLSFLLRCPVSKHDGSTWSVQAQQHQLWSWRRSRYVQSAAFLTATWNAGNTCEPQSQLFIFQSISYTPTFSFLYIKGKQRYTFFYMQRFRQFSLRITSVSIWLESELVLFMTWKVLLFCHIPFLSCFMLPLYKLNILAWTKCCQT